MQFGFKDLDNGRTHLLVARVITATQVEQIARRHRYTAPYELVEPNLAPSIPRHVLEYKCDAATSEESDHYRSQ